MERKNRNILVVLIAVVIAVAMISSFGFGIFAPDTASIVLPEPVASSGLELSTGGPEDGLVQVDVTPQTVQNVIATLSRPESYYREVTVEDFWGDGESGTTVAKVWVDAGWTRTEVTWPGGTVRNSIVGEEQVWFWYGNDRSALTAPADEYSADLEGQRIPTYETVLALEQESISAASYEEKGGLSCIYVETTADDEMYVERYWVSIDSGLLVCAETEQAGVLVYRMSAYTVEQPVPADTTFALPDGTILHTVNS